MNESLDWIVQAKPAMRAFNVDERQALTSPAAGLELRHEAQWLFASRTPDSGSRKPINQEKNTAYPKRPPAKGGRHQRDTEEPNHKPYRRGNPADFAIAILKNGAQTFHGARFYTQLSAVQSPSCHGLQSYRRVATP